MVSMFGSSIVHSLASMARSTLSLTRFIVPHMLELEIRLRATTRDVGTTTAGSVAADGKVEASSRIRDISVFIRAKLYTNGSNSLACVTIHTQTGGYLETSVVWACRGATTPQHNT
jgi:hypothetical protein